MAGRSLRYTVISTCSTPPIYNNDKERTMATMCRKLFVSILVAVGLCGSLLGIATAQETDAVALFVPRFGPGVAGNVTMGPITPVCRPHVPCDRPFAEASVQVIGLSRDGKEVVGTAVTNTAGNFIVSVPAGTYLVHVETEFFPPCDAVKVAVDLEAFAFVAIDCDSGLR
jgi:hypothetical protein